MLGQAVLSRARLCQAVLCHEVSLAVQSRAAPGLDMPCRALLCHAVLCHAVLCRSAPCRAARMSGGRRRAHGQEGGVRGLTSLHRLTATGRLRLPSRRPPPPRRGEHRGGTGAAGLALPGKAQRCPAPALEPAAAGPRWARSAKRGRLGLARRGYPCLG